MAETMKAARIHEYGQPDVLIYEDAPRPEPGAGEVLIRVYAAGINPTEWKTRQGRNAERRPLTMPAILGYDVSGVVEALGSGVTEFQPGDEVYGMLRFPAPGSAYAEYATAPVAHIARKPAIIDHVHAAAVPLAGLTAWQALFDTAFLYSGQTVLIHAAAGGVGHLAVQLAVSKGAKVIGTASEQNETFLREIGVEEFIDYASTDFATVVQHVDVVLDTIGGDVQERSFGVLRKDGILVSIVGQPSAELAEAHKVRAKGILVQPNAAQLAEIAQLIDKQHVAPVVSAIFPLAEAHRAHELGEKNHTRGKIVLQVVS